MISVSGELSVTSYTGFGRASDPANFIVTELFEGDEMYRDSFSLVNYKDRTVIVAGGVSCDGEFSEHEEDD